MNYFHENFKSDKEFKRYVSENPEMTMGEFGDLFKKPDWCQYGDAVRGGNMMGCMSLWKFLVKDRDSCSNCDQCEENNVSE
jgi:hypothetical protein